jgi:hypothetical protein
MVVDSGFIEKILNSKKIRYDKLNSLLDGYISQMDTYKQANIYVDLQSVIKQLYNDELLKQFQSVDDRNRIVIVSEIVNLVGHFRNYFATRKLMFTNFYFYYSFKESTYHKDIYSDYRSEYYEKRNDPEHLIFGFLNRVLIHSMKLVKTIMMYIPHCTFINTLDIEPSLIPYSIINSNRVSEDDINFILTNDKTYYQDLTLSKRTYILTIQGTEKSRLITKENVIDCILTQNKSKKNSSDFVNVTAETVKIVQPMIVNKDYELKAINRMGYARAFGIINKGIDNALLDNLSILTGSPDYETIAEVMFKSNFDRETYIRNAKLLDHRKASNEQFSEINKVIDMQNTYIEDPSSLMVANQEIFNRFPINLEFVFMGEDVNRPGN